MAFLNKKKQGRDCEYCNSTDLRAQGYATHLRIKHPKIWDAGKVLFPNSPAWEWPENLGQVDVRANAVAQKMKDMETVASYAEAPVKENKICDHSSEDHKVMESMVTNHEPTFAMGAGNALAIPVLGFYKSLVMGSPIEAERIDEMIDLIVEWQMQNPTKIRIPFSGGNGN